MTFFPDLSPFTYAHCTESLLPTAERAVNIGWLGEGRVVPVGDTSDAFRAALELICANHVVRAFFRGYHDCEYCPEAAREQGKGEIWVRGANGCWYAAPKLILHYVTAHGYRPPDEFIEAVLHPSEIGKDPEMLTLTEAAELRLDPEFAAMVRLLDSPPTDVDATARPLPDPPDEAARPWWRFW